MITTVVELSEVSQVTSKVTSEKCNEPRSEELCGSGIKFQISWKAKYIWIEYNTDKHRVFCSACTNAVKLQMPLPTTSREKDSYAAFVINGFSNWKRALDRFSAHERSELHKAAVSGLCAASQQLQLSLISVPKARWSWVMLVILFP